MALSSRERVSLWIGMKLLQMCSPGNPIFLQWRSLQRAGQLYINNWNNWNAYKATIGVFMAFKVFLNGRI